MLLRRVWFATKNIQRDDQKVWYFVLPINERDSIPFPALHSDWFLEYNVTKDCIFFTPKAKKLKNKKELTKKAHIPVRKKFRQLWKWETCAISYLLHARIEREREYHYLSNKSNTINKVDEIMKVSIFNPNQNGWCN